MKAKLVGALASALWLGAFAPSYADSYSTSGLSASGLGAADGYLEFDKLNLSPGGGPIVGAGTHVLNSVLFTVGINSNHVYCCAEGSLYTVPSRGDLQGRCCWKSLYTSDQLLGHALDFGRHDPRISQATDLS